MKERFVNNYNKEMRITENQIRFQKDAVLQENAKLKRWIIYLLAFSITQSAVFGVHVVYTHSQSTNDKKVAQNVETIHEKIDLMSNKVERSTNKNLQHGAAMRVLADLTSSFNEVEMKRLEQQEDEFYAEIKRSNRREL